MDANNYVGCNCLYIDNVTSGKKYEGTKLGICVAEGFHSVNGSPIVWFEKPFLGFTWQYKESVKLETVYYYRNQSTGSPTKAHIINPKTDLAYCGFDSVFAELTTESDIGGIDSEFVCKKCLKIKEMKEIYSV